MCWARQSRACWAVPGVQSRERIRPSIRRGVGSPDRPRVPGAVNASKWWVAEDHVRTFRDAEASAPFLKRSVSSTCQPLSVGVVSEDQRELGHLAGERIYLGSTDMAVNQEVVAFLCPTRSCGKPVAHWRKRHSEEYASAGERLINFGWGGAELPQPQSVEDIVRNMPRRAVRPELSARLSGYERGLVDIRKVVGRDIGDVEPGSEGRPDRGRANARILAGQICVSLPSRIIATHRRPGHRQRCWHSIALARSFFRSVRILAARRRKTPSEEQPHGDHCCSTSPTSAIASRIRRSSLVCISLSIAGIRPVSTKSCCDKCDRRGRSTWRDG